MPHHLPRTSFFYSQSGMLFFSCPLSHAETPLCRVGATTGNVIVTMACILITFFGLGITQNTYIPPQYQILGLER